MGAVLAIILPLILQLLGQVIPALGPLIVAVIKNLTDSLNDDADRTVMVADQIVQGIADNPANFDKTGEEKYRMAFNAMKVARPNLSDSMTNCLIELAVQSVKERTK